jgi:hypothetical protein
MGLADEAVRGVFRGLKGGFDPLGGERITAHSDPWMMPLHTMTSSGMDLILNDQQYLYFKTYAESRWGPDQKIFVFR